MSDKKRLLIVGSWDEDGLFLDELLAQAKFLGFEVDTFLWLEATLPTINSHIYTSQKHDVIVVTGPASERWWVKALNNQTTPVVYNSWSKREPGQELGLTVRHLEIAGGNVHNVLRCAQQLTA